MLQKFGSDVEWWMVPLSFLNTAEKKMKISWADVVY